MRISDNVKRVVTELVILCLLQEKDMYGYELFQEMKARSDQKFTLIETSLYVPFCLLHHSSACQLRSVRSQNTRSSRKLSFTKRTNHSTFPLVKGCRGLQSLVSKARACIKGFVVFLPDWMSLQIPVPHDTNRKCKTKE